jgi:hypothetical protein
MLSASGICGGVLLGGRQMHFLEGIGERGRLAGIRAGGGAEQGWREGKGREGKGREGKGRERSIHMHIPLEA